MRGQEVVASRRRFLAFGMAFSTMPSLGIAEVAAVSEEQALLARFLYALAPLPAFTEADCNAASLALLARADRSPALEAAVKSLLPKLRRSDLLSLSPQATQRLLRDLQGQPEFRVLSNPALGLLSHKAVWPRIGYEGSAFEQGGYRYRGFDDIKWLPASASQVGKANSNRSES